MSKDTKSTSNASDSTSIDARRKSFITVLARVLARDLQLVPPVAKKMKQEKRNLEASSRSER